MYGFDTVSGHIKLTSTNGTTYSNATTPTAEQIINAHSGQRTLTWQFNLIDWDSSTGYIKCSTSAPYNPIVKSDITSYVSGGTIVHDSERAVHRTLTYTSVETAAAQTFDINDTAQSDANIDYLNNFVQPVARILAPDGGWLLIPCGVFMFTRPMVVMSGYAVARRAELADLTQLVLSNEVFSNNTGAPLTVPASTALVDIVYHLLTNSRSLPLPATATLTNIPGCGIPTTKVGSTQYPWPTNTQVTAKSPPYAYQFKEGTNYLDIINQLLLWASCEDLWCDENGNMVTTQRPANGQYKNNTATYTYDTTTDSIIDFGGTEEILIDDLVTAVQVIVEDPARGTIHRSAVNTNGNSPISSVNWKRNVVKTLRESGIPSADATDWVQTYANNMLQKYSFLADRVVLPTAVNPCHGNLDVCLLNIYQQIVANGGQYNWPIVATTSTPNTTTAHPVPGLVNTEKFVELGWQIDIVVTPPGNSNQVSTSGGQSTLVEPRERKQGHYMQHTFHRVTSLA